MVKDGIKVNFEGTGEIIGGAGRSPPTIKLIRQAESQFIFGKYWTVRRKIIQILLILARIFLTFKNLYSLFLLGIKV